MAQQSRWPERVARALRRRTPERIRRGLRELHRRFREPVAKPVPAASGRPTRRQPDLAPVLSVVIPIYNVEPYLAECLESVQQQSFSELEVLLVDDGSTDGSRAIMERFVRSDGRFVAFGQANQGQGAARNLAVRQARGEFLTFVDGDDIVPKGAFAAMVKSLRASGSDMVVGAAMRLRNGRLSPPVWNATVHQRDRLQITIDDFPGALWDVIACNRMFRREFWVTRVGEFASGASYEDHVPMVKSYLRAAKFDLLSRTTYHWRYREDLTSESQQKHRLDNLEDRLAVKVEAGALLEAEASSAVRAAWLGRVLDTDLAAFIDFALMADDQYRATLREAFRHYRLLAGPEAMSHIRVLQKIRGYLVSEDRWDDLVAVQAWFREVGGMPSTEVIDGHVYVVPQRTQLQKMDIPVEVRELAWHETGLRACLATVVWIDDSILELTGWAYPANIDLADESPSISLRLVGRSTGTIVDVAVEQLVVGEATRWSGQRYALVDAAGFRARVQTRELSGSRPDSWQLEVSVRACGVERTGSIFEAVPGSSASAGLLTSCRTAGSDVMVSPHYDPRSGFVLRTRQVRVELRAISSVDGSVITGEVAALGRRPVPEALTLVLLPKAGGKQVPVDWVTDSTGPARSFSVDAGLLATVSTPARWELRRSPGSKAAHGVAWPGVPAGAIPALNVDVSGWYVWERSASGTAQLVVGGGELAVRDVEAGEDEITFIVHGAELTADERSTVELRSGAVAVPLQSVDLAADGSSHWRFANCASRFGLPSRPLPPGTYSLRYQDRNGVKRQVPADPELRSTLVREWLGPHHRVRLSATADVLRIHLSAPLREGEVSRRAQTAQLARYRQCDPEPEQAVLFQSWDGGVAAGDQLALHRALGRMRPELRRYWVVTDKSVIVPAGARAVLLGSKEYWDTLARTRFLCSNVDLGPRLFKRTHQRFLQTFDGHPFSAMGRRYWEGRRGKPEAWIQTETARLNQQWDALVAPNRLAAQLYRSEFDYRGEILTLGNPRCDALVAGVAGRRLSVRRALGASEHQTVTLYAPTARDLLTTRGSAKRRFDELDLPAVVSHLGPRHQLWVRGHQDNKRVPDRVSGIEGVRDLTDYPDVNDLIMAADVLLTDYSAIRFDWALTGKPMVFFVVDEGTYFATRPALFEFADSAPGPVARTPSEVIELLAHPTDLARRNQGRIAEFNRRFNRLQDGSAAARVVDAFFN